MASQDVTAVTVDELLEDICQALDRASEAERPGPGWFTVKEIAEAKGWSYDRTKVNLDKLIKRGMMEMNEARRTKFYRMK